jgi:hypothetical protein
MSTGFNIAFDFEVGQREKHRVGFYYSQFWGNVRISVDGEVKRTDLRIFSLSLVKSYRFTVGTTELHEVQIDKNRALFFAGFRPQIVRAFVDGQIVAQDQSLAAALPAVVPPTS